MKYRADEVDRVTRQAASPVVDLPYHQGELQCLCSLPKNHAGALPRSPATTFSWPSCCALGSPVKRQPPGSIPRSVVSLSGRASDHVVRPVRAADSLFSFAKSPKAVRLGRCPGGRISGESLLARTFSRGGSSAVERWRAKPEAEGSTPSHRSTCVELKQERYPATLFWAGLTPGKPLPHSSFDASFPWRADAGVFSYLGVTVVRIHSGAFGRRPCRNGDRLPHLHISFATSQLFNRAAVAALPFGGRGCLVQFRASGNSRPSSSTVERENRSDISRSVGFFTRFKGELQLVRYQALRVAGSNPAQAQHWLGSSVGRASE